MISRTEARHFSVNQNASHTTLLDIFDVPYSLSLKRMGISSTVNSLVFFKDHGFHTFF